MNTTGTTADEVPMSLIRAISISLPETGSSSSSYTVGLTPMPENRRLMTWHMQQLLMLNITTAFPEASCCMRATGSPPAALPLAAAMLYSHDSVWYIVG
ncbi:hypothetical protein LINPERPRIM_LOCUS22939 [Linum perenne]